MKAKKALKKKGKADEKPAPMAGSKYVHLLDDADVKRWFNFERSGSEITGRERLRRLGAICERFNTTPQKLARMRKKQAKNFLLDMISDMEQAGLKANYIRNFAKALKSWFRHNEISMVDVPIKISKKNRGQKYKGEQAPIPDELRRILEKADPRRRIAIALIAFSGLREESLGDYLGLDGLKVGDFPEMVISGGKVDFTVIPTKLIVRDVLSKAGHEYFTFLNAEGADYLRDYLEERMRPKTMKRWSNGKAIHYQIPGEVLTPESPIITPVHTGLAGKHIRTTNIGDLIRGAMRRAGYSWRPYVCRRYFQTRMMNAEDDKLIIKDHRVFLSGYVGDISAVYTLNKSLDRETMKKLRDAYARADKAQLTTRREKEFDEQKAIGVWNRLELKYAHYSDAEIEQIIKQYGELSNLSPEQVQELCDKKEAKGATAGPYSNGNGGIQKMVTMDELSVALNQGCEFLATLPDGRAIVRLPMS